MSQSDLTSPDIARLWEAGDWVQRLNEPDQEAQADQWQRWCEKDPLNLPAYERMRHIWNGFPQAGEAAFRLPAPSDRRLHRRSLLACAASVLLLVGVAGWFALRPTPAQVLETPVGEQRQITLSDGSHLDLGPDSRVSTRFKRARREVELERGQAFFAVSHDALRPFVVHVNGLTVTAVGTAFDVRTGPGNTLVTVSEGRVSVAPATGAGPGTTQTLGAEVGQRVTFSRSANRLSVSAVDPKLAGSWRGGTLQFAGEPLEDVVGTINRYSTQRIAVAPALQKIRFTGTVSPANVHDWLKALEQIYAVVVVDEGHDGILIRLRAHGAGSKDSDERT